MERSATWLLAVMVLLGACGSEAHGAGDAGQTPEDASEPELDAGASVPYTLCDGSDGVRLGIWTRLQWADIFEPYVRPYGAQYLFVMGDCSYVAGGSLLEPAVAGTLDPSEALKIEQELELNRAEDWPTFTGTVYAEEPRHCNTDESLVLVVRDHIKEWCQAYGNDPASTASAAVVTMQDLTARGAPIEGPVDLGSLTTTTHYESLLSWPLDVDLASLSVNGVEFGHGEAGMELHRFEDGDADVLKNLRDTAPPRVDTKGTIVIYQSRSYELFILDALPEQVVRNILDVQGEYGPHWWY